MSEIKQENNQLSKYQELNDLELEVVCGGDPRTPDTGDISAKNFTPETVAFTKSEST